MAGEDLAQGPGGVTPWNGSGSLSASANAGTASGDAQLPRATQTLRSMPALFARLIGEPRRMGGERAGIKPIGRVRCKAI
ncbi:MAG: hypothetical protein IPK16_31000 [Anaerolineales bacterium]|nr:hypothetical protein [Anaerolineales bacterium]